MKKAGAVASAIAVLGVAVACSPVPEGFNEYVVFERLDFPTALSFAPDGRVFVAEKRGVVQVFDSALDDTPTAVADLRTNVFNGWDRGLLDVAVAPDFTVEPMLYVLYTYDAPPGQQAPVWGQPGVDGDNCPTPPGPNRDGCVVTARLSRLPLDAAGRWTGVEQVLLHDWCQQYPSHTIGTLAFGADGALYVSGGDGASFTFDDYGQAGIPRNPCGDPPSGVGGAQTPPSAEGGSLRSQDVRTLADPTGLDGAVLRLDPDTGAPLPDNPLPGSPDQNARRIVAFGARNPFRFAIRPGTSELWIGDVGSARHEEINVTTGDDTIVDNLGWPCYEGPERMRSFDLINLTLCESLYAAGPGAIRPPWWSYSHDQRITPEEDCDPGPGSAISGIAFAPPTSAYPDSHDGALYFADAVRGCIWTMPAGGTGLPDPAAVTPFVSPAGAPTDLTFSPNGELWYVDHYGGTVKRVGYEATNRPPQAALTATPTSGNPPLAVRLDASASSDPDPGDTLTYTWDLDNDGAFDDGTGAVLDHTFTQDQVAIVRVRVADTVGDTDVATTAVTVGDPGSPSAVVVEPPGDIAAAVGATVHLDGFGLDDEGHLLPPSVMRWQVDLLHCPSACHTHSGVFSADGQLRADFVVPDHEQPASMVLRLSVTHDGETATTTRRIDYVTTEVTIASEPAGVTVSAGGSSRVTPFTRAFATNGTVTVTAPGTTTIDGVDHAFVGWSDGGARSHEIVVPDAPLTLTATYAPA